MSFGGKKLRFMLMLRDGKKCRYCKKEVNLRDPRHDSYCTIEHVVPKSRGGNSASDNLAISCLGCNRSKANKLDEEMSHG